MEEIKVTNLGSSLPVPCVQELAKEALTTVPPRYVRLDQDPPFVSDTSSLPKVPVIDMQSLTSKDLMDKEMEKLHHACKHWGFFQLINHGVNTSLLENVKSGIQEFFNLPMEEKKKFSQQTGDIEGFGQAFVVSEEQKLDWADLLYMITLPVHLRKPHLLPKLPLPFRIYPEIKSSFCFGKVLQFWLAIGLNSHSDAVGLTILLQVNEMEGLQIRQDGMWIPVKPLHNAFVVNIGDILEIVTNGIYRSIEHRATVNSECERLSIATFYSPKLDGDMGPAPSLVKPERPALFKRIGVADYFKGFFSRELHGKSYVDAMRI
ncbi:protein srg1 [Quercus suber]|uniref:Protein srg1 n=1 Tax=Quercus suber TaxID=58331 RepID=A0AAW0KI80_QUESU